MAVKTSNQHHIGQFQVRSGGDSALHLYMHTYIPLKTVKMVEIEPESDVPASSNSASESLVALNRQTAPPLYRGSCVFRPHPTPTNHEPL